MDINGSCCQQRGWSCNARTAMQSATRVMSGCGFVPGVQLRQPGAAQPIIPLGRCNRPAAAELSMSWSLRKPLALPHPSFLPE